QTAKDILRYRRHHCKPTQLPAGRLQNALSFSSDCFATGNAGGALLSLSFWTHGCLVPLARRPLEFQLRHPGVRPTERMESIMKKKFLAIAAFLACVAAPALAQDWEHAVSLFNQKQTRAAIREFHAVLKANPDAWQSWYYIGFGHYQLQEYADTVDSFNNYLKSAAKDDKAQITGHYFLGWAEYQLQQYDKAIPEFTQYIALAGKGNEKVDVTR